MRHLLVWAVSAAVLWWLWLLLAGEWNRYEWIAAAGAAAVAAGVGTVAWARAETPVRLRRRLLRTGWSAFPMVFVDFGILMAALVRSAAGRRVVRGEFRTRPLEAVGSGPAAVGTRVWTTMLADYSPNAYVVDVDRERGLVLLHDLVRRRGSEKPA